MQPLLGIGLPIYNDMDRLKRSVESVLQQTFQDFVLYIFDDQSTDASYQIAKILSKYDNRISVFKNSVNRGQTGNFNKCLSLATFGYKYISIKSSDDVILPQYYEKCIDFLENNPDYVLCYTEGLNTQNIPGRLISYDEDSVYQRIYKFITTFQCGNINYGIIRGSIIDCILPYSYRQGNDNAFNFHLALLGKLKKLDDVLYDRNIPLGGSKEQYMKLCKTGLQRHEFESLPNTRVFDMLLAHLKIVQEGFLNNLDAEQILEIVIKSFLLRFNTPLATELAQIKLFLQTVKTDNLHIFNLRQEFQKVQFLLRKYSQ